jgi:sodium transport system permease protein
LLRINEERMTRSTIKIIAYRELRDLLRDRRTLFMIFVLPTVLYPLLAVVGFVFALGLAAQPSVVGIAGADQLPTLSVRSAGFGPGPALAWLSLTPPGGVDRVAGSAAFVQASQFDQDYPPLVVTGRFPERYWEIPEEAQFVRVEALPKDDRTPLETKQIDVLLIVPSDFRRTLDTGGKSVIELYARNGDERSRLAEKRVKEVLFHWRKLLQQVRLRRHGLPQDFAEPVVIHTPERGDDVLHETTSELADVVVRFFPIILVTWAMAGALYPSIDVCAGEKERGTLETLLLSPASRADIVVGKFLAVWLFSSVTALWNFAWMGGGAWVVSFFLPFAVLSTAGLIWCSVLAILLSALFSAVSLALGAYARSTKEGQYYLLPMFIVTMPLTFLPLVPGVELNLAYSLVPITGATLLLQKLMTTHPEPATWLYFGPVLFSLIVSISLALWWAVAQFRREEVLFREAQGLDFGSWVRRLLGKPSPTQAGERGAEP